MWAFDKMFLNNTVLLLVLANIILVCCRSVRRSQPVSDTQEEYDEISVFRELSNQDAPQLQNVHRNMFDEVISRAQIVDINPYNQTHENNSQQDASSQEDLNEDTIQVTNADADDVDDTLIQAKNAKYQFATRVDNNIEGNFHQREETRDGLKVTGSFAYDDGNIFRSVNYVADEKGFRIIKERTIPSIKAMQEPDGQAAVQTFNNGEMMEYKIMEDVPIKSNERK